MLSKIKIKLKLNFKYYLLFATINIYKIKSKLNFKYLLLFTSKIIINIYKINIVNNKFAFQKYFI